jgi:hypothetical protein
MLILNFTHPLTDAHKAQIEAMAGLTIEDVHTVPVQLDQGEPLEPQIRTLLERVPLTPEEWQTSTLLINPPGYAPAAFVLLAELHGRMGHFPTLIRLRPKPGPVTSFEVAELLNLQMIRDTSRQYR